MSYLLGYDIGSSSIKAALVNAETGSTHTIITYPEREMEIIAQQHDWAEQDPEIWWENVCKGTRILLKQSGIKSSDIKSIGIAYQMHGLVLVNKDMDSLRPSIIWCDSRAVEIGNTAYENLGAEYCNEHLLNSPGNFTASKLGWVKENEPEIYKRIHKIMLPGDFIAMKLTGEINSTISGLSEGIFWDFKEQALSKPLLEHFGFGDHLIPEITPAFSIQGMVSEKAANATGLKLGTPVSYRAGDQPNNAFALGVNEPGEVAATGGTSGVVYGITNTAVSDPKFRVNTFAHVNYSRENFRAGVLLCINGAGITYSWLKNQVAEKGISFQEMEELASNVPENSDGLSIVPFGNGAERMLQNANIGATVSNLNFNRHSRAHLFRAGLEGVAYSFVYGIEVLKELGLNVASMRVGNDNLFQSKIFSETITGLLGCKIEVISTTGASGAARGSGFGSGIIGSLEEAAKSEEVIKVYDTGKLSTLQEGYEVWKTTLHRLINNV